jgi:hypothetical protein
MDSPSFPIAVMGNLLLAHEAADDAVPLFIAHRAGVTLCRLMNDRGWQPAYLRKSDGSFVTRSKASGAAWFGGQTLCASLCALRWLERLNSHPQFREASIRGVDLLLQSQSPLGGWPALRLENPTLQAAVERRFGAVDLEHGATTHAMRALLLAARLDQRADCLAAVQRAGLFLADSMVASPWVGWARSYNSCGKPLETHANLTATVHALHGLLYAIAAGGSDTPRLLSSFLHAMDFLHQKVLHASSGSSARLLDSPEAVAPIEAKGADESTWLIPAFNRLLLRLKRDILCAPADPMSVAQAHQRLTRRAHALSQVQSYSGLFLSAPDKVCLYDTPLFVLCHFALAQRLGVSRALDDCAHWEDFITPDRRWLARLPGSASGVTNL